MRTHPAVRSVMTRRTRFGVGVTALALAGALTGCSADKPGPDPTTTAPLASSSAPATTTTTPTLSQADAVAELQSYLDAWAADGPASASKTYLATDQQVNNDADAPKLATGKVVTVTGAQPTPDGGLTLHVTLDMTFDGDPIAWGNGTNERFVTFTPRSDEVPYAMSFATSP